MSSNIDATDTEIVLRPLGLLELLDYVGVILAQYAFPLIGFALAAYACFMFRIPGVTQTGVLEMLVVVVQLLLGFAFLTAISLYAYSFCHWGGAPDILTVLRGAVRASFRFAQPMILAVLLLSLFLHISFLTGAFSGNILFLMVFLYLLYTTLKIIVFLVHTAMMSLQNPEKRLLALMEAVMKVSGSLNSEPLLRRSHIVMVIVFLTAIFPAVMINGFVILFGISEGIGQLLQIFADLFSVIWFFTGSFLCWNNNRIIKEAYDVRLYWEKEQSDV